MADIKLCADIDESDRPFTVEKLNDLIKSGKMKKEDFFSDQEMIEWAEEDGVQFKHDTYLGQLQMEMKTNYSLRYQKTYKVWEDEGVKFNQ